MPTTKDFLVKVKDLPEFDGLKLTPDNKLRIPDATINLGETAGGVATNTLNKDHFNLGSGTTTMLIEPDTFRMIKDIPADVEQETDAEYYKVEIDSVHQTFTIYDTDRITPIFQVTSGGLALGSSVITGITSQGGNSSTLAASQLLVNGKQNTLTAGANIQIVNDVISAVLTEASNIIGTTDPQVGQGSSGVLYLKYEDTPSGSHVDPETGETVTDYTREIVNVYGNIGGLWYEFPEGSLNLFGTTPPTADMGDNGSIYMQFNTVDGITQVYGKVNDTWYPFGGGGSVDPAIQKKVDELDETAIRTDAPLYTIDGEPLETISETQLEARSKNNIEDNVIVTQVQTSGTEIAQVQVGSRTTSIYAPSGGGGGSNVSITPALATGTKIADYTIDSTSGSLYAPTPQVIEANPAGTATEDLSSVRIGNTIYDIPSGGGSGNIINDTLYTNPPDTLVSTITLSNPYTDYDILIFRTIRKADNHDNYLDKIYNVKDLNTGDYLQLLGWSTSNNYYTCQITSNTVLTRINSGSSYNIHKIYGIKINGGGSSGGSHDYSTDEQVVGTWIDGSTLYEKTFNLAGQYSVLSSGWGTTGITYNDYFNIIVGVEAVCQDSSSYYYIPCSATKASATGQLLIAGVTANQNRAIQYLTVRYTKPTT